MRVNDFMKEALQEAKKAMDRQDVPVGAVIIYNDTIIARGYNERIAKKNSLLHAEMVAIDAACNHLGSSHLEDCTLYVTLEPCAMCTGAIMESRLKKVVFGALDSKAGCILSQYTLLDDHLLPHHLDYEYLPQEGCKQILIDFFKKIRK